LTLSRLPADFFLPLGPAKNRTGEVVERLAAEIASGRLAPGARLPTEQEMTAALGVSRTVVREAVAALRAEGLVETRQGVGAFVVRDVQRRPFRIDPDGLRSIAEVVQIIELRTGVEVEAASLAAERASVGSRRRIASALSAIDVALSRGESAIDEDFAFHQAIAAATENPHSRVFSNSSVIFSFRGRACGSGSNPERNCGLIWSGSRPSTAPSPPQSRAPTLPARGARCGAISSAAANVTSG